MDLLESQCEIRNLSKTIARRAGAAANSPPAPSLFKSGAGMFEFLKKIMGSPVMGSPTSRTTMPAPGTRNLAELARRLGLSQSDLQNTPIAYRSFQMPKRSGGSRTILAPEPALKAMQRRILRRLLARLKAHSCATGFERGHSIVTNARPHVGQSIVIKLDLQDFFSCTPARRIEGYFRRIGWDADSAALLARLCTYEDSLPQGAPTSPRLSNLVNYRLDARIAALAEGRGVSYSRYADDITLSASPPAESKRSAKHQHAGRINDLIAAVKKIAADEGYTLHTKKKLRIARRHDQQIVTGIVVNDKPNLPRIIRRRLRAIEHHQRTGKPVSMTPQQLAGWKSLQSMVLRQGGAEPREVPA